MVFNVGKKACMNKSTVMRLFIFAHSVHQNLLRRKKCHSNRAVDERLLKLEGFCLRGYRLELKRYSGAAT